MPLRIERPLFLRSLEGIDMNVYLYYVSAGSLAMEK